ncbi:MAG: GNAT family N-acetyltransferase [Acidimicrobiia bacterium]|nr:GNAT family N-acetyltransferase [Acidimicrobiia bacterium]
MGLEDNGYTLREFQIDELDEEELARFVAFNNVLGAEAQPRHVDLTPEEFVIFTGSPGQVRKRFMVLDDEKKPVAHLQTSYSDDGSSPNILQTRLGVLPEHRRNGIGTALLVKAATAAKEMERPKLSAFHFDTVPAGKAFADYFGATPQLDFHSNAVKVADLDLDLLQSWVDQGPNRAPGYSVRVIEGVYPDELLEGMAHLYFILERDMPHPDNWEPREWTAELVKQMADHYHQGSDSITAIAIHDDSGAPVGMSQLVKRRTDPKTWFVSTTMVDPEHRGLALGKWVKGAVNLAALERWPAAEWQETGNAFTNEAMLGINHAMGFRHEFTMTDVEFDVDEVLKKTGS